MPHLPTLGALHLEPAMRLAEAASTAGIDVIAPDAAQGGSPVRDAEVESVISASRRRLRAGRAVGGISGMRHPAPGAALRVTGGRTVAGMPHGSAARGYPRSRGRSARALTMTARAAKSTPAIGQITQLVPHAPPRKLQAR